MNRTATKGLIYMTARDCEVYVANALSSLARQTHDDLHVLFVDDCSTDATGTVAQRYCSSLFPGKHTFVRNETPWGKARNAHVHLRSLAGAADFIAVLDADDELVEPTILARVAGQYEAGFDVVWTNYVTDRGVLGPNGPLDPLTPPRGQGWKTSHFFSFRAELLANVDERYFQDATGAWLPAACDMALAYPILDQTRRYSFLPVPAYRYTDSNPRSHHNADPKAQGGPSLVQRACAREILHKPPLPCTRSALPGGAPEEAALRYLRDQLGAELRAVAERVDGAERASAHAAWRITAAAQLAELCPSLLDLMASVPPSAPALDVMQAWSLLRLVRSGRPRPRVLEIGAGPWAAPLAAIAQGVGGAFWSVTARADRAEALLEELGHSRAIIGATVRTAGTSRIELPGATGAFPDLTALGEERDFDVIAVSLAGSLEEQVSTALVSLPASAGLLSHQGFTFCLLTDARELQHGAAEFWRRLSPELHYVESGCAGHALVVTDR